MQPFCTISGSEDSRTPTLVGEDMARSSSQGRDGDGLHVQNGRTVAKEGGDERGDRAGKAKGNWPRRSDSRWGGSAEEWQGESEGGHGFLERVPACSPWKYRSRPVLKKWLENFGFTIWVGTGQFPSRYPMNLTEKNSEPFISYAIFRAKRVKRFPSINGPPPLLPSPHISSFLHSHSCHVSLHHTLALQSLFVNFTFLFFLTMI